MSPDRIAGASMVRSAAALATTFAMMLGVLAPAIAADTATFNGAVIGTDSSLGERFTVIYKDVATGQEFRSGPTNAAGEYQVSVPVGGKYKLDSVLAPDGTKLAVQNVPPIKVAASGQNRVDVKFTQATAAAKPTGAAPAAAATAAAVSTTSGPSAPKTAPPATASAPATAPASAPATAAATPPKEEKKDKSAVPWWKRPGPIVGMVLGGVAIGALALSGGGGDDNNNPASASLPSE